jgi:hypothetical protein
MRCIFVTLTVLTLSAAFALAEPRIFHLQNRPAADIVETVRTVLGSDAKVVAADDRLFVNATPSELAAVTELLGVLDRPPAMLRISVAQNHDVSAGEVQIGTSGSVSIGSSTVVIGRPDTPLRGRRYDDRDHLRIGASSSHHQEYRRAEQFIVTLEGHPARISVGRRIPFTERWLVLAHRHAHVVETIRYESVDTGFEVQPDLLGAQVQLHIYPFMAFQNPQQPCEIQFQELTTTVRIPLGEWYDLGGTMAGRDEVSREILGSGNDGEGRGGFVRIKVELQPN